VSRIFAGLAYATGRGKPLDKQRALSLFHRSCDAGWRDGCIRVANVIRSARMDNDPERD
jgi:hypothetical protein